MHYFHENNNRGFSLVELLIAMAVGLVVLGAVYSVFIIQNKTYKVQEQVAEMQQNARAAMDMMTGEIRMAGYDPAGSADAGITNAASDSITFTLDITNDAGTGPSDGNTGDANENITYSLYTPEDGIQKLGRKSTAGANNKPVVEHVQSLDFQYWDEDGGSPATAADVRRVKVTITMRTAKPDPDYTPNGGYRTYSLTSVITPRNLGF